MATASTRIAEIDPAALFPMTDEGRPRLLIDLRETEELARGVIAGSIHVPRGVLEREIGVLSPDRSTPIVLLCESGKRGALATETLGRMGFTGARNLAGGIERWIAEGRPVERAASRPERGGGDPIAAVDLGDWAAIRAQFPIATQRVAVDGGTRALAYLDHAATTHPPLAVLEVHSAFLAHEYANVHRAGYALARGATLRFERCFEICAAFIGGNLDRDCVVFVPNTTAGCDLVAHTMATQPGAVLVTGMEHHSNDLPHRRRGEVLRAAIDDAGRLDYEDVERLLTAHRVKLIAVTGAANLTGWMPDLARLARLAHAHGARICVDAAQLMAHHTIDVKAPGDPEHLDFLVAAGHKMYAPFGAGFVYGPRDLLDAAEPWIPGGGTASEVGDDGATFLPSPDRHQGGTPNVAGIVAMGAMLELLDLIGMDRVREHEMALLRRAWSGLAAIDGVVLHGPPELDDRVGILPFSIEGVSDMLAAAILGEEGAIAVRNGRFCAHPHARRLLGPGREGAVRASIGLFNDEEEIDRLVAMVRRIRERRWSGRYEIREGQMSAQLGGRCADRWMQSRPAE